MITRKEISVLKWMYEEFSNTCQNLQDKYTEATIIFQRKPCSIKQIHLYLDHSPGSQLFYHATQFTQTTSHEMCPEERIQENTQFIQCRQVTLLGTFYLNVFGCNYKEILSVHI